MNNQKNNLKDVQQLPCNVRVFIYGSGSAGQFLCQEIKKKRKDIKILGFIDSFKNGELSGLPIIRFQEFCLSENNYDFVIIAATGATEIISDLEKADINYWLANVVISYHRNKTGIILGDSLALTGEFKRNWPNRLEKKLS
jgi:FlaA1/EpsC-like NDP-sugar epimerase